jgi:multimeric flavodoxin WrbA
MTNYKNIDRLAQNLKGKRVLLITTSNRWSGAKDVPKSTQLAEELARRLYDDSTDSTLCTVIDAAKLHIYPCEGNVSTDKGNTCGVIGSAITDTEKNPTGHIRCWASINHADDELWKLANPLLDAEVIIFFVSVRWGQTNAIYQKLIERLNWLENRWTTLNDTNILKDKDAGIVIVGHNWNGENILNTQKQVLSYYGFNVPQSYSFNWQWTTDESDESEAGYRKEPKDFAIDFNLGTKWLSESFKRWQNKS